MRRMTIDVAVLDCRGFDLMDIIDFKLLYTYNRSYISILYQQLSKLLAEIVRYSIC